MKKEIIRYLLLSLWFCVVAFTSYRIGLEQGKKQATNLPEAAWLGGLEKPKVEKLTFYETLNQPSAKIIRQEKPTPPSVSPAKEIAKPEPLLVNAQPQKSVQPSKSHEQLLRQPWAVQVAAFEDGAKAVLLKKELEQKGYEAFTITVKVSDLQLYRVLVAASDQEISKGLASNLQKSGYSSSFVVKR